MPVWLSQSVSESALLDGYAPERNGAARDEDEQEGGPVEEAQAVGEDGKKQAGIAGVADEAIGAGVDKAVVIGDGDVGGEEAAEVDNGIPADYQCKCEEGIRGGKDELCVVKIVHGETVDRDDSGDEAGGVDQPDEGQRMPVFGVALGAPGDAQEKF